jgi:hypothetical protein
MLINVTMYPQYNNNFKKINNNKKNPFTHSCCTWLLHWGEALEHREE